MTDKTWSSEQIGADFSGCQTIGEIVRKIELLAADRGEVVCEIRLNDKTLSDDLDHVESQAPTDHVTTIAMTSEKPERLVVQALQSSLNFIPVLMDASLGTSGLFRDGELGPANGRFKEVVDGCQWFVDTLNHTRGAASGIGAPVEMVERWNAAERMLFKVVEELTETFDRRDAIGVADILEFELTTAFEMWQPILLQEFNRRAV